jgi:hypothetical protein
MCNPALFVMASAAMQVGSSISQGITAKGNANLQAADMEYQAAVERDNAQQQAAAIRRQGQRDRGSTVAAVAASGVKIGDGSAADAELQVMQDANTDERLAILRGDQTSRQLNARAKITRRAGRDAQRASYINAATSLMSAAGSYSQASGTTFKAAGWDAGGFNGTNDRGAFSMGSGSDWWARNGRGGD